MISHIRKNRYSLLLFILLSILYFTSLSYSAPVSKNLARQVANNFLKHIAAINIIESVETYKNEGTDVAYIFHLSPRGYLVVAGDNIRIPVKGYSLNSNFSDLPEVYTQNILRELKVSTANLAKIFSVEKNVVEDNANSKYWEYLTKPVNDISKTLLIESYTPDTYLLTTQWNQDYPYNKLNPTIGGQLTLTGCVQTAIAQVMRYHSHPATGTGVFTHTWNSQTLTAVMNRSFNWDIMPNTVDGSVSAYQQDEVAALMRDIGILNEADFDLSNTSTSFYNTQFARAFGYAPVSQMSWQLGGDNTDSFFNTIGSEIDNLRPVLLSMPGHMVVADGYASDGAGRKIHLNLGWGGSADDYYFLDTTVVAGLYSFPPDHTIYYNLRPCTGDECNPYSTTGGAQVPVINFSLNDIVIDEAGTILRIDAYDPDGEVITLSASSACTGLQMQMDGNLLTITPIETSIYCEAVVQADSAGESASKTFNILSLENADMLYSGEIGGEFADQDEVDEYRVYLEGDITISGYRGYSNTAFYIWVEDQYGSTVLGPNNPSGADPISGTLSAGIYSIYTSLSYGYSYFPFDSNNAYTITVTGDDLTNGVPYYADSLGITLFSFEDDECPSDPGKTEPGQCGCGVADTDTDEDGTADCIDTDDDEDGMPDAWETQYGLSPLVNDSNGDADGDGFSNLKEYQKGTDPTDSSSHPPRFMPWLPLLLDD